MFMIRLLFQRVSQGLPLRLAAFLFTFLCVSTAVSQDQLCRIRIVEKDSGWPVPLVELVTNHQVRFVSDNAGEIAFDLPELMNRETWFFVKGHGYSVPKDGFGYEGVRITPVPGKTIVIEVERNVPAKRLGRITGAGIFAESQRFGDHAEWREQLILGCDSVQTVVYQDKLYWAWGDTVLAHYPLGRFHMIGATTSLQPLESFKPPIQLRYDYFTDNEGVPRNVAEMPGDGPTWLGGFAVVPDGEGNDHFIACYSKIEPPLAVYEFGLCEWNDEENRFTKVKVLWDRKEGPKAPPQVPMGHPVQFKDTEGQNWLLFGDPFPYMKCPATYEAWIDPEQWTEIEAPSHVRARAGDEKVQVHRGSIAWNDYRKKWVAVFSQFGGESSVLGELWYTESDSPFGPWRDAVKVVTHDRYTVYNPRLHPEFTDKGSPILLFEATYTKTFSKAEVATPRHEYNQVLYRIDLGDAIFNDE